MNKSSPRRGAKILCNYPVGVAEFRVHILITCTQLRVTFKKA
jgi:hypothetical protein